MEMSNLRPKEKHLMPKRKLETASYKGDKLLNKTTEILVICIQIKHGHRQRIYLKIVTQKTDVINQSHNVIEHTGTLS